MAIDNTARNIFVADNGANIVQVFNEGIHLHKIPTAGSLIGIALTDEFIIVSTVNHLLKIRKSNNNIINPNREDPEEYILVKVHTT